MSRPGYLVPYTDPVFKTKIIRMTGDPGSSIRNISGARWGDQARHHYSSDQAWNCDQSMIYLDINKGGGAAGRVYSWTGRLTSRCLHPRTFRVVPTSAGMLLILPCSALSAAANWGHGIRRPGSRRSSGISAANTAT